MSTFKVVDDLRQVVLETDDWVDAEVRAGTKNWPKRHGGILYVRGTHPTHDWYAPGRSQGNPDGSRRCRNCGGWDNGSYGSHAPCGYDWNGEGGSSLVAALERELATRAGGK